MKYLVFVILMFAMIAILIIINSARPLALKYRQLESAHAVLFGTFRRCHEYLLKTYPDLDTREYLDIIESQELKDRFVMEMEIIAFDDQVIAFKKEFLACYQEYRQIYDQYQKMIQDHPCLAKILHGLEYEDYRLNQNNGV